MHWGLADIPPAHGKQPGVSEWSKAGRREHRTDVAAGPETRIDRGSDGCGVVFWCVGLWMGFLLAFHNALGQ